MRRFHFVLAAVIFLNFSPFSSAFAANHEEKDSFARSFADKVLAILQDPKKSYGDRKDILRTAFATSVDIDWIAKFVLGSAWNQATDEEKERYTALYRKYLTETYVANFGDNPERRISDIKIFGINEADDSDFTVRTEMRLADAENLKVDYLVRENDGTYKILDISIENVSLIATHRAEFKNIIASQGLSGVIAALEQKLAGDKPPMTLSMN